MKTEDYYQNGKRRWIQLHEKGGKRNEVPAHHNAETYLDAYLDAAGIRDEKRTPLFRNVDQWRKLTENPMTRKDVLRIIADGEAPGTESGAPLLYLLPHVPGDRNHRLPGKRQDDRERASDRSSRVAANRVVAPGLCSVSKF